MIVVFQMSLLEHTSIIYMNIYVYITCIHIGVYWQQFLVNASNIKLTMGF